MVRALWTSASGMTSQQLQVDTISNNIANVNTTGYKKEMVSFKSLLYQQMGQPAVENIQAPSALQVGHGVRVGANTRVYGQGTLQQTGNVTDLAIEGNGFFSIIDGEQVSYTRDGNFRFASTSDESGYMLTTSDGKPVMSVDEEPIVIDSEIPVESIQIGSIGNLFYIDQETGLEEELGQIQVVQFANTEGLEALGDNEYRETAASGPARIEGEDDTLTRSHIRSGNLEGSNVNIADEMVNLIVAQRAYEMNSTVIKTVDTMLQQANELKRS